MSIWGDNPEWFDEWIEQRAMDGELGEEIKKKVLDGDLMGYEIWADLISKPSGEHLDFARRAEVAFCERFISE